MEQKEITPNEIKGVDLIVKALKKKYNFIKGFKLDNEYMKYDNTLFIYIIVDYNMVSDYYGMRIKPWVKKLLDDKDPQYYGIELYNLTTLLDTPKDFHQQYMVKERMRNFAEHLYTQIPTEIQRTYSYTSFRGVEQIPVNLRIYGFIVN